ncbi:MAG: hypothetical protein ABIG93_02865 [archaeon]
MRKLLLVLLSLCMILLVSCGGPDATPDTGDDETGEVEEAEDEGESLGEALTDFTSSEMTCTYIVPEGEGTFYLKDNKFRVEIIDETRDMEYHYLIDDEYMYIWQPGDPNSGIKWSLEYMQEQAYEEDSAMDAAQNNIFGLNEVDERDAYLNQYNAHCTGSAPNSKFSPPNYDFMDMSALMAQYS